MYWQTKEGSACLPVDVLRIATLTGWLAGNTGCCTAKRASTQSLSNLLRVEYASYTHCLSKRTSHSTNPTHSSTPPMPSIPNCVAGSKSPPTAGGTPTGIPPSTPTPLPWLSDCARSIDSHECFAAASHAWSAAELPRSDSYDLAREALSS
ncbi:hypothetical protein GQ54DRAFT_300660 [Martensiomyces pterosporus]|nr:hypothetical protein GQ54DRAFT_300660 [Martensiomyces pterosporus]